MHIAIYIYVYIYIRICICCYSFIQRPLDEEEEVTDALFRPCTHRPMGSDETGTSFMGSRFAIVECQKRRKAIFQLPPHVDAFIAVISFDDVSSSRHHHHRCHVVLPSTSSDSL